MQVLVWTVADLHYAVPVSRTVEVVPVIRARPLPDSPAAIRGWINVRGQWIELVDMGMLLMGRAVQVRMASRILVVDAAAGRTDAPGDPSAPAAADRGLEPMGLLVASLIGLADLDFVQSPPTDTLNCLGPLAVTDTGTIQLVHPERIAQSLPVRSAQSEPVPKSGRPPTGSTP